MKEFSSSNLKYYSIMYYKIVLLPNAEYLKMKVNK